MNDRALRDMWLQEMWRPCRELSRSERARLAAEAEARDESIRDPKMSSVASDTCQSETGE